MQKTPYEISLNAEFSYTFISEGISGKVLKAVVFQEVDDFSYNLALLDYDNVLNTWSDMSNTNNYDISRTMKTVLVILLDFLERNHNAIIIVKANSDTKRLLYNRIFRNYYLEYAPLIRVLTDSSNGKVEAKSDIIHEIFYICKNK